MDQGLGSARLRRSAEGTVGAGGQRQRGEGSVSVPPSARSSVSEPFSRSLSPQVKKAFQGRVMLPGYSANRYNASLALSGLRSSDSGLYRCEIVVGINDEQDTVPLEVTGEFLPLCRLCDQSALL